MAVHHHLVFNGYYLIHLNVKDAEEEDREGDPKKIELCEVNPVVASWDFCGVHFFVRSLACPCTLFWLSVRPSLESLDTARRRSIFEGFLGIGDGGNNNKFYNSLLLLTHSVRRPSKSSIIREAVHLVVSNVTRCRQTRGRSRSRRSAYYEEPSQSG